MDNDTEERLRGIWTPDATLDSSHCINTFSHHLRTLHGSYKYNLFLSRSDEATDRLQH